MIVDVRQFSKNLEILEAIRILCQLQPYLCASLPEDVIQLIDFCVIFTAGLKKL